MKRLTCLAIPLALALSPVFAHAQETARPKPTNAVLTFHVIEADGFQGDDAEIRPIVTELRRIFRFQGYRLVSKSVLTGTAWPASHVSQQVAADVPERREDGAKVSPELNRVFTIDATLDGDGQGLVRLSVSLLARQVNPAGQPIGSPVTLIDASVNVQDGKTVVLGSSRQAGQSAAIILAVTPRINP